jgi:hypothetical protein
MKNPNGPIGNQTSDLPASTAVPQPNAPTSMAINRVYCKTLTRPFRKYFPTIHNKTVYLGKCLLPLGVKVVKLHTRWDLGTSNLVRR